MHTISHSNEKTCQLQPSDLEILHGKEWTDLVERLTGLSIIAKYILKMAFVAQSSVLATTIFHELFQSNRITIELRIINYDVNTAWA